MKLFNSFLTTLFFIFGISQTTYSQNCTNCDALYPAATQSTTSNTLVTIATDVYGGEYSNYNVTSGETYTWSTCGDTDFDTELSLTSGGCNGTYLSYDDDFCGSQSTITWTASFTGVVTLLLSEYDCSNNSTDMTIEWACTSCGLAPTNNLGNGDLTDCSGTLFDSGGGSGNYANDEIIIETYCSDAGDCITIDFTAFNTEDGVDVLTIYDGTNGTGTWLGDYSGTNSPGTVTSISGCLTFVWSSDFSDNDSGWEATISCAACPAPTCADGVQNGTETGIDCGGTCPACPTLNLIGAGNLSACSGKF